MIAEDEDALSCDFAETYHILDFRALPARRAALLASGLGPGSRIVRKLAGMSAPLETLLLAAIADALRILVWQNTKNGLEGIDPPASILDSLRGQPEAGGTGFDSIDEFDAWRASMIGG